MRSQTARLTLVDAILPRTRLVFDVVLILGFSILTALSAQVSFWIGPVPITGQTFAVLLSGALLGARRGALSQLTYIAIGATGLPFWFALGGVPGVARIIGPTGGYLFGFVAAAFVIGWFAERGWDRRIWTSAVAMVAGSVVIYVFGAGWLAHSIGVEKALGAGVYPFLVGDVIKIVMAALALPAGWRLLNRYRSI